MPSLLKDLYSPDFYHSFSNILAKVLPDLDKEHFQKSILDANWKQRELKERMKHTSAVLSHFFPKDFVKAAKIIQQLISVLAQSELKNKGLELMFLPDYIEKYGMEHLETSARLFEIVTPLSSCEFAVRPFIIRYEEQMLSQMLQWSLHENHHVRRLASEGCRPRLPWAIALPKFKKDPNPILPILENLKQDASEYVRRSVANNINDIAKDNPHITIEIAKKWKGKHPETDALVKHACRNLLKQGEPEILALFGLNQAGIELLDFKILNPRVAIGSSLQFALKIQNTHKHAKLARLEYAVYFKRQNGSYAKKVFKISEREPGAGAIISLERKHSFKPITTRKYYKGDHRIAIIINGKEMDVLGFELG
jgi:3-methyladenine DNA glycosylase AlkC